MRQITANVWPTFQDSSGRILDEYSIKKWTFYKGTTPDMRAELWLFLLDYYPFTSTRLERENIDAERRKEYLKLIQRLKDFTTCHGGGHGNELAKYLKVIEKDSVRTDCSIDYFGGERGDDAIQSLERVLGIYVIYDPKLGYVQGMNELLSPLMVVFQSEHQSFWCLVNILKRMRSTFTDLTLTRPLSDLARLCLYADSQLHNHIDRLYDGEDWLFCYRGVLLNLKREFSFDDVLALWETIWSNHSTTHYQLFVAVAILVHYKSCLMQCTTVESLMEFSMGICGRVPLEPVQMIARLLLEQLKADEYCPYELRHLVSGEGCAPPPLVGFVRARQKLTTLHSNKIKRDEVWKMMFGDGPVQAVTTPFIFNSLQVTVDSKSTTHTDQRPTESHPAIISNEPPKAGFIPRLQHQGICFREAIRQAPTSPFISSHLESPMFTSRSVSQGGSGRIENKNSMHTHWNNPLNKDTLSFHRETKCDQDDSCITMQSLERTAFGKVDMCRKAYESAVDLSTNHSHLARDPNGLQPLRLVREVDNDGEQNEQVIGISQSTLDDSEFEFDNLRSEPQLTII